MIYSWLRLTHQNETDKHSSLFMNLDLLGGPENSLVVLSSVLHLRGFVPAWENFVCFFLKLSLVLIKNKNPCSFILGFCCEYFMVNK